jgi:hypothetical protein
MLLVSVFLRLGQKKYLARPRPQLNSVRVSPPPSWRTSCLHGPTRTLHLIRETRCSRRSARLLLGGPDLTIIHLVQLVLGGYQASSADASILGKFAIGLSYGAEERLLLILHTLIMRGTSAADTLLHVLRSISYFCHARSCIRILSREKPPLRPACLRTKGWP